MTLIQPQTEAEKTAIALNLAGIPIRVLSSNPDVLDRLRRLPTVSSSSAEPRLTYYIEANSDGQLVLRSRAELGVYATAVEAVEGLLHVAPIDVHGWLDGFMVQAATIRLAEKTFLVPRHGADGHKLWPRLAPDVSLRPQLGTFLLLDRQSSCADPWTRQSKEKIHGLMLLEPDSSTQNVSPLAWSEAVTELMRNTAGCRFQPEDYFRPLARLATAWTLLRVRYGSGQDLNHLLKGSTLD